MLNIKFENIDKINSMLSVVDCKWGDWVVGKCSRECGIGTFTKIRSPETFAAHGGLECLGLSNSTEICNAHGCPGLIKYL